MDRASLRRIVERSDTFAGHVFAWTIQSLVIASLVSFSFETLPDLSPGARSFLRGFELFTVAVFSLEYLLRLWVAERRLGFVFSFLGIVDLIAILPYYLGLGTDLRAARAFRMVRILRLLKLARYSRAVRRLHRAALLARDELMLFFAMTLILLYVAAVGIYTFEHDAQPERFSSVFASLWWAVATLTTVGYGDIYPITVGGRVFTFVLLMVGLGIVAVPTGLVSAALSRARDLERDEEVEAEAAEVAEVERATRDPERGGEES